MRAGNHPVGVSTIDTDHVGVGATWTLFGHAMPQVVVSDLYMPPDGSVLRASTYGRSVWEFRF